ncbi:hypothetical protein [Fimbriiglobus ruber]|uniref:Uncharacterized protein n=1 Tax=Fimbriiglobus ruber TaxID=1908690 RepID=A0A225E698_9BACT|nr:hypothetical protein [Fimbriiglobus ruber]OWK47294.1 hypothetical protein FRUB_00993 [Fimbriiglobus ruber]
MTAPGSTTSSGRVRPAEVLGIPATADESAAKASFLKALQAGDFLPPESQIAAVNAFSRFRGSITPATELFLVDQFRADVDGFAAAYWDLSPGERWARWLDLTTRTPNAMASDRLEQLKDGLDVEATSDENPAVEELARLVRGLYVLHPRARAVARAEWVAERAGAEEWRAAARCCGETHPPIVALDPVLFDQLGYSPSETMAKGDVAAARAMGPNRQGIAAGASRPAARNWLRRRMFDEWTDGKGWTLIVVTVVATLFLMGIFMPPSKRDLIDRNPDAGSYPAPAHDRHPAPALDRSDRPSSMFTPEQIREFEQYNPDGGRPAPSGYNLWRIMTNRPVVPSLREKLE